MSLRLRQSFKRVKCFHSRARDSLLADGGLPKDRLRCMPSPTCSECARFASFHRLAGSSDVLVKFVGSRLWSRDAFRDVLTCTRRRSKFPLKVTMGDGQHSTHCQLDALLRLAMGGMLPIGVQLPQEAPLLMKAQMYTTGASQCMNGLEIAGSHWQAVRCLASFSLHRDGCRNLASPGCAVSVSAILGGRLLFTVTCQ